MIHALIDPFVEFAFMRRALVGCFALSLGAPPVGVFLVLRRLSLMGDAMSHAILPGAAIGFLVAGLSVPAMSLGGFIAGIAVVLLAGFVTRSTILREDASLAAFYLVSLALGVLIVSVKGSSIDLLHVLFGTVLALDDTALILIAAIATLTMLTLAIIYRPLVLECFDPSFLASVSPLELSHPLPLPRARGDEPGRRLPGARHADGGRHHAVAGDHRALLGARHLEHDRRRGCARPLRQVSSGCCSPTTPTCPPAPRSSSRAAPAISSPCSSACRAAFCGSSCRANISKLESKGRSSRHEQTFVFRCCGSLCRNARRRAPEHKPPTR